MKKPLLFVNLDIFIIKTNQILIYFINIIIFNFFNIYLSRVDSIILDFRINNKLINN